MRQDLALRSRAPAVGLLAAAALALFLPPSQLAQTPPQTVSIGTGSGSLIYPHAQAQLKLRPGDTLAIRPGIYRGISLGNLSGSAAAPITVVCNSCFNTLYRSRKAAGSKDPYVAPLVDVYGPDVIIKHNLIIEPEADAPFDPARNYVYHLGAGPQPGVLAENNLVFRTLALAGLVDASSFAPAATSPARDAATGRVGYITTDHYNHSRYVGAAADVGAVERQEGAQ